MAPVSSPDLLERGGEPPSRSSGAAAPAISLRSVRKSFGQVRALDSVDFDLAHGEVRALLGSNGAGKSTLMKVVSGAVEPDGGSVSIDGVDALEWGTSEATAAGVASVYQDLSLVPAMSVGENILLGRWPQKRLLGKRVIDTSRLVAQARAALGEIGEHTMDVRKAVGELSIGQRQIVEIAKALSTQPSILILDEPTSALMDEEVDKLISLVRVLASRGLGIVYVSHRMNEIPRVADSVTVMRDGRIVDTIPVAEATSRKVARMMVGEDRTGVESAVAPLGPDAKVRLSVTGLRRPPLLKDVTFDVRAGEVLGIAGLMGSGRTELLRCIFGRDAYAGGTIAIDGHPVGHVGERDMIAAGVGLVPEERRNQGLVTEQSVSDNLTLAAFHRFVRFGIVSRPKQGRLAREVVDRLNIKVSGISAPITQLSGGNQQKVVLGKWLAAESKVLLLDEPTRGVDIHSKQQIYDIIRGLAAEGRSVVFVSSEIEELFAVCHRIAVLNHGVLTPPVLASETNAIEVLALTIKEADVA